MFYSRENDGDYDRRLLPVVTAVMIFPGSYYNFAMGLKTAGVRHRDPSSTTGHTIHYSSLRFPRFSVQGYRGSQRFPPSLSFAIKSSTSVPYSSAVSSLSPTTLPIHTYFLQTRIRQMIFSPKRLHQCDRTYRAGLSSLSFCSKTRLLLLYGFTIHILHLVFYQTRPYAYYYNMYNSASLSSARKKFLKMLPACCDRWTIIAQHYALRKNVKKKKKKPERLQPKCF